MAEIEIWYCKETKDIIPVSKRPHDAPGMVVPRLSREEVKHDYYERYIITLPED